MKRNSRTDNSSGFGFSRRDTLKGLGAASLSALTATALLPVLPRQAGAALYPVKLGYQFHLWGAPAVVGLRRGFFKDEGLTVEERKFSSGKDTRDAMIAGSVNIGTVGITPFIVGASKGLIVALGVVCYAGKTGVVMARAGAGIKTVGDLRGKKIASQVGSTLDNVFKKRIAPAAGLSENDYEIANSRFSEHVAALAAGSVDAFLGLEPFCSIAEEQKIAVPVTDYYKYDLIPNMLAVQRDYVEEHPETCVAFLRGWLRAVEVFEKEPEAAADIMVAVYRERKYDVNEAIIRSALKRLIVNPDYIPELPQYIENQAAALKATGRLDRVPDPDDILRRDLLAKARAT